MDAAGYRVVLQRRMRKKATSLLVFVAQSPDHRYSPLRCFGFDVITTIIARHSSLIASPWLAVTAATELGQVRDYIAAGAAGLHIEDQVTASLARGPETGLRGSGRVGRRLGC